MTKFADRRPATFSFVDMAYFALCWTLGSLATCGAILIFVILVPDLIEEHGRYAHSAQLWAKLAVGPGAVFGLDLVVRMTRALHDFPETFVRK